MLCAFFYPALAGGDIAKNIAGLVLLPALAFSIPVLMLTGAADGETYNEGFVCASAIGWWIMLWGAAAWAKLIGKAFPMSGVEIDAPPVVVSQPLPASGTGERK
jgi:hypothetical protein